MSDPTPAEIDQAQQLSYRIFAILQKEAPRPNVALTSLSITASALIAAFSDGQSPVEFAKTVCASRDAFVASINRATQLTLQRGPVDPTGAWMRDV